MLFQQSNLSGVDRVITSFSVDYDKQPSGNNSYLEATLDYAAFDKSYVRDFFMTEYTSDTIPNAALVQPYITYRKDDNLLNLSYAKYEVENGIKGSVQLFRSGNYDTELNSDTLVLVYDKGDVTPETRKKRDNSIGIHFIHITGISDEQRSQYNIDFQSQIF